MPQCPHCKFIFTVKGRSKNQNDSYWGLVIYPLAEHLGIDPNDCHELMKYRHNSIITYQDMKDGTLEENKIVKSTTVMTTIEFRDYYDRIIRWAENLSPPCYLQKPNEPPIMEE